MMAEFSQITSYGFYLIFIALMFAFATFALVSLKEGEKRAAKKSAIFFFIALFVLIVSDFFPQQVFILVSGAVFFLLLLFLLSFFLPVGKIQLRRELPSSRIDERDIPFSRIRLVSGTEEYKSYYEMRPKNQRIDDRMRQMPGLLSQDAKFANAIGFRAADSSFDFIETFRTEVEHDGRNGQKHPPASDYTEAVKRVAGYYGAHSVGIAELADYHIYSNIGRGTGKYGDPIRLDHRYAVAFTVKMDHRLIRSAPQTPVVMESGKKYVAAATIAMQLALFISKMGYSSRAHIDGNYRVIAPLVARDAGLGEIGRMGLLMTPDLGPRVRIGVVTTDMPLSVDEYKPEASVIDFCLICKKCAENCPSRAIQFDDRHEIGGALRWQINADSCFQYWNVAGTDCGKCISVCPYAHPDNFLHQLMRKAIKHSGFARRTALQLDDLFYGKNPEEFPLPGWLETESL